MSLLEKDKIMLQHRSTEYQRKADQEAEKRRNLENEGKGNEVLLTYESDDLQLKYNYRVDWGHSQYLNIVLVHVNALILSASFDLGKRHKRRHMERHSILL